ncbi:hypothetical protein HYZ97_03930, partial [Candidatus Pacearchaeota archaeon]|nr:hypothetical protein [Candidatus Pacearchaeota archaeon]
MRGGTSEVETEIVPDSAVSHSERKSDSVHDSEDFSTTELEILSGVDTKSANTKVNQLVTSQVKVQVHQTDIPDSTDSEATDSLTNVEINLLKANLLV